MRVIFLLALVWPASGQPTEPASASRARASEELRARDYDSAITSILAAVAMAPARSDIRKDLAYTYLKVGENGLARDQFREAMLLKPDDIQVAMEYAFLCYESKEQAQARRIFDRVRRLGNATAEHAFRNIDTPLAAGIERWKAAIARSGGSFSAHYELATLAEQRDELALAADHYQNAWRLLPDRRSVLVDLGRVWRGLGRIEEANAALLAASRGGEPRAAELARELLPGRYPYVPEFRRALELDAANVELRRELGYLLLRMDRKPEAMQEFRKLTEIAPEDLLAATQLGFLLYAEGEVGEAQPYFERVLKGNDDELANRVRAVLHVPQVLKARAGNEPAASIDAKVMAERSIRAGYMKDALRYLQVAHEADPGDFDVMRKLGWAFNILHQDRDAFRWFDLARRSPDPQIAAEAGKAWHSLKRSTERFRFSGWLFPLFSSRWNSLFSYGQVRMEIRPVHSIQPYVSLRFIGDSSAGTPQMLSERSAILAAGVTTTSWRGIRAWAEAGESFGYTARRIGPDYRGGLSVASRFGRVADTTIDAIYVSRFNKDFLVYDQSRIGRVSGPLQTYWNVNLTFDSQRQYWANFLETGPGIRIAIRPSSFFTVNLLRGAYLRNEANPRRPNFVDLRAGFWYAFSQ
jgi:Tfp pilus assembly protein PilF